jgi:hypothetical protein
VTNPDGETGSLPGVVTFTIEDNRLTRVSCGASTSVAVSPASVVNGAFSASGADGLRLSGRVVAPGQSSGDMEIPSCGAVAWFGEKR